MITKEQAIALSPGTQVYVTTISKYMAILKVNGACKTWKRNPERWALPYKHGLYAYGYIGTWHPKTGKWTDLLHPGKVFLTLEEANEALLMDGIKEALTK